jgi:putative ABC transport system permease protein
MRGLRSAVALAWRLLWHDPARLGTSLGGIAFAVLLMLLQMGFRNSLLDSEGGLLEALEGDVFVLRRGKEYSLERDSIPKLRVQQTASVEGVAGAWPLRVSLESWKNLETGTQRPIRVLGIRPGDPVFRLPEVQALTAELDRPYTALVDRLARARYFGHLGPGPAQVQRQHLEIVGTFAIGTDLEADGNLVVSNETFTRIGGSFSDDRIEMVVVKVTPGVDPGAVVTRLKAALPGDVTAVTRAELRDLDRIYWDTGTPVSVVVLIGMLMGFCVGVVICYQILYTEVADHLPEFATLKAIGYGKGYLLVIVLTEALLIPLVGLVPSLAAGAALYAVLGGTTGLLLRLTAERALFVAVLTVCMCVLAGLLAVRKVLQADPAELF